MGRSWIRLKSATMLKWLLLSCLVTMVMSQDYYYSYEEEIPDYIHGVEPVPEVVLLTEYIDSHVQQHCKEFENDAQQRCADIAYHVDRAYGGNNYYIQRRGKDLDYYVQRRAGVDLKAHHKLLQRILVQKIRKLQTSEDKWECPSDRMIVRPVLREESNEKDGNVGVKWRNENMIRSLMVKVRGDMARVGCY